MPVLWYSVSPNTFYVSLSFEIGNLFAFYVASYIVSEGEIVEYMS